MMRQEFEERLGRKVTDSEYDIIETVYTFHPSISETKGKEQIVALYEEYGMRIIADMYPTALYAKDLEDDINAAKRRLESLTELFAELRKGERVSARGIKE